MSDIAETIIGILLVCWLFLIIGNAYKINTQRDRITVLEEVCNDAFIEGDKK